MMFMNEVRSNKVLMIHIDGKAFQPSTKILAKDQLLELAGLDPKQYEIVLIDGEGKAHQIDSDEGLELQDGMEFRVRQNPGS
jgi:hypothetical protein